MAENLLPTAEQMLKHTRSQLSQKLNNIYASLKEEILAAANNGETWIFYNKHLPDQAVQGLKDRGYGVRCAQDYNDIYYVIRWDGKDDD